MAKFEVFHILEAKIDGKQYSVIIGAQCIANRNVLLKAVAGKQVCIITNETVAPLYLAQVKSVFQDFQCDEVILPDGEAYKNQTSLFTIYNHLYQKKYHRDATLIALGGGVIGDITGFAAATFKRGLQYIQLPTSLLAQIDAAIGGKTGINFETLKNGLGSFYQPKCVVIDVSTLASLPQRELLAAGGELLKYALLDVAILEQLKEGMDAIMNNEIKIAKLIAACCQMKLNLVQHDPFDRGARLLLNLGHTVGHALEAITHYKRWLHGEAVAIGLYVAMLLSKHLGFMREDVFLEGQELWNILKVPKQIPEDIDLHQLLQLITQDKKNHYQKIRFILLKAPGEAFVTEVTVPQLMHTLKNAVEGERICMTEASLS